MLISFYHNICDKYDVLTNITDVDVENIFLLPQFLILPLILLNPKITLSDIRIAVNNKHIFF